jgi:hypothetical protein
VIAGEGEVVAGVQPAVIGMAERVELADVDHRKSTPLKRGFEKEMVAGEGRSSVTHVTSRISDCSQVAHD